jgi:hypothetical protein
MLKVFFVYLVFFAVGEGVLWFDEETLIIFSCLVVIEGVGRIGMKYVTDELERRGYVLSDMLMWYYNTRTDCEIVALRAHHKRFRYMDIFEDLTVLVTRKLLNNLIKNYLYVKRLVTSYEIELYLINGGLDISVYLLCRDLKWLLGVIEKNKYSGDIYNVQSPYNFAIEILSVSK